MVSKQNYTFSITSIVLRLTVLLNLWLAEFLGVEVKMLTEDFFLEFFGLFEDALGSSESLLLDSSSG